MIDLLDYVLDFEDNFWIVNKIDDDFWGYKIYTPDSNANRYNNITKKTYKKNLENGLEIIPEYKMIFKPRAFYQKHKKDLNGVWLKYVTALNEIGIRDDDIGIFGSYLIGFDIIKDVDFCIYGEENLYKYYENNDLIKSKVGANYISDEHALYQYNKHKDNYSHKCDLYKIIRRNWSGIQIGKVLSTPRFIDLSKQKMPVKCGAKKIITCKVKEGLKTAMLPRRAKVSYKGVEYELISSNWKYQSFLEDGDVIECACYIDKKNKTILLPDKTCYVKFFNNALLRLFCSIIFMKVILKEIVWR